MRKPLYVTSPGSTVRLESDGLLVVTWDDYKRKNETPGRRKVLLRVARERVEMIMLMNAVHITRDALDACLEDGISLAWLSAGGKLRGRLEPVRAQTGDLRWLQHKLVADPQRRMDWARNIIHAKLMNAAAVLEGIRSNRCGVQIGKTIARTRQLADKALSAETRRELLGIEGMGARTYFDTLAKVGFIADIGFVGRRRNPPPDPANALLSLAYTLLVNQIATMLESRGLDSRLGFLHRPWRGRPSLALDLAEEFRHPLVDRMVLRVCNRQQFKPDDFEPDIERSGGLLLKHEKLRVFFAEWRKAIASLPDKARSAQCGLKQQQELCVKALREKSVYRPHIMT